MSRSSGILAGLGHDEVDALGVESAEDGEVILEAEGTVAGCHGTVHCTPWFGVGAAGGVSAMGRAFAFGQEEGVFGCGAFPISVRHFRMAVTAASYPAWYAQ